ncbi:H/ACA RNA-protein complex component Cbf5p [Thermoplasmatales archaeon SG8-52-1]|nr:MAG: H/ACA RNA-protein complex component Cbf5p [Thermoplasmatales archaeon SG8-52-1]
MNDKKHVLPSDKKRKRLVKVKSKTNPNYGKSPDEYSVYELLNCGIINLDKPSGPTSHQIDSWIKEILSQEKVGHGGTLDPNATGILPIAIGDATKALQALLSADKEYIGVMKLHKSVDKKKIIEVCNSFIGEITQIPPVRSAVKRVKRKRNIYYLDVLQIKHKDVLFCIGCESGTYVRTLCVNIGKQLKTGAHLDELRRTRVGRLSEGNSVILQDLKDAYTFFKEDGDEKYIRKIIFPMERLFDHLPKIVIRDSAVDAICHGASLAVPGVVEVDSDIKKDEMSVVLTLKGEGVSIVKSLMSTEEIIQKDSGVCASLLRVLMKKGTYPSIWKKS